MNDGVEYSTLFCNTVENFFRNKMKYLFNCDTPSLDQQNLIHCRELEKRPALPAVSS